MDDRANLCLKEAPASLEPRHLSLPIQYNINYNIVQEEAITKYIKIEKLLKLKHYNVTTFLNLTK